MNSTDATIDYDPGRIAKCIFLFYHVTKSLQSHIFEVLLYQFLALKFKGRSLRLQLSTCYLKEK